MSMNPRLLKPTASGFSPRSISGLALWLDASSSDLYTTDAGPVTAVASPLDIATPALWLDGADSSTGMTLNGSLVETWKDKSGNGRDFTASGTARPTLTASAINSRSALTFNGSANTLTGNTAAQDVIRNLAGYTVFSVLRTASVAAGERLAFGVGATVLFRLGQQDSRPFIGGRRVNADTLESVTDVSGSLTVSTTFIQTAVVNHSLQSLTGIRNGAAFATDATYMAAGSSENLANAVSVGTQAGGTYGFWNGEVAEIIVYPTALATADRARVEAYLAAKWGISGVHAPATATSDPVGYWGDRSGNGRHAVQATAGNRPAISATNQGGKRALAFPAGTTTVVSPATVAQYVADATTSPKMFFAWVARPEGGLASIAFGSPTHPNNASRVFYASDFGSAGSHIVDFGSVSTARLIGAVGDEANNVGHVYSAFRDGAVMSIRRDGVEIIRKTNCTGVFSDTTGTLAINTAGGGIATSSWMEFMAYAASIPAENITRLERYLSSRWGITLAPQVANADAQDWINRVYANGGTVSSATAAAVNSLCDSLDASGVRPLMYRMGIFAGSNLNAALVPLYRGPSLGGTQYGGTTDTNTGPFVSGDFADSTGLAAGSGKYLRTGVTQANVGTACHIAFYDCVKPTNAYANRIGSRWAADTHEHVLTSLDVSTTVDYGSGAVAGSQRARATGYTQAGAFWLGVNPTATSAILYKNGVSAVTVTPSARTSQNLEYWVFALNNNGTLDSAMTTGRAGGYSIGLSMDATQAAAYNTAMQAFQTSLTRNA